MKHSAAVFSGAPAHDPGRGTPAADYTTVSAVKSYLHITSDADDASLDRLITRASAMIDHHCGRWFAPIAQTRTYRATGSHITGRLLLLDADLISVSRVMRGDGSIINPSTYILRPVNWPPYFGISLKQRSGLRWSNLADPEGSISVVGTWGYAAAPPEAVVMATIRLAAWLYGQRDTTSAPGAGRAAGSVSDRPRSKLPSDIKQMLGPYVRLRISVYGNSG